MLEDLIAELRFCVTRKLTTPLPVVAAEEFSETQSADVLGVQMQVVVTLKLPEPPEEANDALPAERANEQGSAPG